jgi:glycosyltransferase involved in cell wall biosynthesis
MDQTQKISAVISTHNRAGELRQTLRELQTSLAAIKEIIVVDNASTDNTIEMVQREFPHVRIFPQSVNHPIRGYNIGFNRASSPYIWVMDDDAVPSPGTLDSMIRLMNSRPDVAAAAGNIIGQQGLSEWQPLPTPDFSDVWCNLIGCGFLIRKKVLNQTGGYAESFGIYYNDLDLALRILALNQRIVFRKKWIVHHRAAPSPYRSGRKNELMLRNFCFLVRSHYQGLGKWDVLVPHLLKFSLATLHSSGWRAAGSALYSGLTADTGRGFLAVSQSGAAQAFHDQYALSKWTKRLIFRCADRFPLLNSESPQCNTVKNKAAQVPLKSLAANRLLSSGDDLPPRGRECPVGALVKQVSPDCSVRDRIRLLSGDADSGMPDCTCFDELTRHTSSWPDYERFLLQTHFKSCRHLSHQRRMVTSWPYKPKFSIITPVYQPDLQHLNECIASIERQTYNHWEWCVVDDGGGEKETILLIESFAARHPGKVRVALRSENLGITHSSREALEMASGDFFLPLDQDDRLAPDLLYEAARHLNEQPDTDFLYGDCDKISPDGNRWYYFIKPDWSPELLLSFNYLLHPSIMRRTLAIRVGGYRDGYEGSQDYDLYLRITEKARRIHHIPKILYSWRQAPASTALDTGHKRYVYEAGVNALGAALEQRGIKANVDHEASSWPGNYRVAIHPASTRIALCLTGADSRSEETEWASWYSLQQERSIGEIEIMPYAHCQDFTGQINHLLEQHAVDEVWVLDKRILPGDIFKLSQLSAYLQIPGLGAISPKVILPHNVVDHLGIAMSHHAELLFVMRGEQDNKPGYGAYGSVLRNVSMPSPVFTMFSAEALRASGGFCNHLTSFAGVILEATLRMGTHHFRTAVDGGISAVYNCSCWWNWPAQMQAGGSDFRYIVRHYISLLAAGDPFYGRYFKREPSDFSLAAL